MQELRSTGENYLMNIKGYLSVKEDQLMSRNGNNVSLKRRMEGMLALTMTL